MNIEGLAADEHATGAAAGGLNLALTRHLGLCLSVQVLA